MPTGVCQLCGQAGDLSFSHIFPEFFYEGTYDESHRFVSVSSHPRQRARPMQAGLREHLLCAACETRLSRNETYVAGLLRRADEALRGETRGVALADVDFVRLRLFALSLLWRAHVSRLHMFGQVRLGPHAEAIRQILLREDPGPPHNYGFALAKITGLDMGGEMIISPIRRRYGDRHAYHFTARGYEWVYLVTNDYASLIEHFPFVGSTPQLFIPVARRNRAELFSALRNAFPEFRG